MDEPNAGLDPQNCRHVWDLINDLKNNLMAVLTPHAMEQADALRDRIGIMSHSRLIALGATNRMSLRPCPALDD
jgi:ABC-2 type transport system ATP-binding protein